MHFSYREKLIFHTHFVILGIMTMERADLLVRPYVNGFDKAEIVVWIQKA